MIVFMIFSGMKEPTWNLSQPSTLIYFWIHVAIVSAEYLPVWSPVTKTRANHDFKFLHYQTSVNCYKFSFFSRIVPERSTIPSYTVIEQTLNSLKKFVCLSFNVCWTPHISDTCIRTTCYDSHNNLGLILSQDWSLRRLIKCWG